MMFQSDFYNATAASDSARFDRTDDFDKAIYKICTRVLTSRHSYLLGQLSFVHLDPEAPKEAKSKQHLIACYALLSRKPAIKKGKGKKRLEILPPQEHVGTFTAWVGTKEGGKPGLTFAFRQNATCFFERTYSLARTLTGHILPPRDFNKIEADLRNALFGTLKKHNYATQDFPAFIGFPEPF